MPHTWVVLLPLPTALVNPTGLQQVGKERELMLNGILYDTVFKNILALS